MKFNISKKNIDYLLLILVKVFIFVTILFIIVPFKTRMPSSGLDPSWGLGMNEAMGLHLQIGKEVILTFGPYASVYTMIYHPATDTLILLSSLFLGMCYAILLLQVIKGERAYLLLGIIFAMLINRDSILIFYPLLLSFYVFLQENRKDFAREKYKANREIIPLLIFFVPIGLLPLIKGSTLFLCMSITLLIFIFFVYNKKKWHAILSLVVPFISCIFFWMISGQHLHDVLAYFINMLPMISGYTEAMSYSGPLFHVVVFMCTSIFILLTLLLFEKNINITDRLFLTLNIGLFLFLSFKAGFVRQDSGHTSCAASALIYTSTILSFLFQKRLPLVILAFAFFSWACIDADYKNTSTKSFLEIVKNTYKGSIDGITDRINNPQNNNIHYTESLKNIEKQKSIPLLEGTTDIYTVDQSWLIASGNKWNPRPIFQSYTVYDPKLSKINELHLRKGKAPDNILFYLNTIDQRLPSIEDGLSWPAIFDNYEATNYENEILYLKKKPQIKKASSYELLLEKRIGLGEEMLLPQTDNKLFAEIDINPTILGKLFNFAFKLPQLEIILTFSDGQKRSFRTVSSMMKSGFFISPFVGNTEQFALQFINENLNAESIKSFMIKQKWGHSFLWKSSFAVKLKSYKFDKQKRVINGLYSPIYKSVPPNYKLGESGYFDGFIDFINGEKPTTQIIRCNSCINISGWFAILVTKGIVPAETFITLKKDFEPTFYIKAKKTPREDVKQYFKQPQMPDVGYSAMIDLSTLKGKYILGIAIGNNNVISESKKFAIPIEVE